MDSHLWAHMVSFVESKCEFWIDRVGWALSLLRQGPLQEFSKWIISCLCAEVSWHSWILWESGSNTAEAYTITFERFEEFCLFDTLTEQSLSETCHSLLLIKKMCPSSSCFWLNEVDAFFSHLLFCKQDVFHSRSKKKLGSRIMCSIFSYTQ